MPMELRKRKAPEPPAVAPATKRAGKNGKVKEPAAAKKKKAVAEKPVAKKEEVAKEEPKEEDKAEVEVGAVIDLEGFGGEIETNDGEKTTLKKLVDESKSGVVLFTYPKASTPGCTKQVCFFRDAYAPLTADGLAIYGLSADSPKANTTFKDKQKLPYALLCDPAQTLIGAIGLKKAPKGTQRGVFVVAKDGKVLVAEPGSPQGTMDRVAALVKELKG